MPKRKTLTRTEKILRSDGALCVTFVNTGSAKRKALASYDDLLAWGVETRALADADSRRLAGAAAEHPGQATAVVRRARLLRQRLERIFRALAAGNKPAADDFTPFNAELRRAMAARELVATTGGYRWSWGDREDGDLDRVLWPVLLSAATLLVSRDRGRVRQCQQEDCGLFFVARGGGRQRKFCGARCLNRSTTRKHYHKKVKPGRVRRKRERQRRDQARMADWVMSQKRSTAEDD